MTGVNNVISFSVRKSKVKVTLCERAPHPPASPSLIAFRFHSLVASLSDIVQECVFMSCMPVISHLKG